MTVRGGNEPLGRIMSLPGLRGREGGRRLNKLENLLLPCRSGQLEHIWWGKFACHTRTVFVTLNKGGSEAG